MVSRIVKKTLRVATAGKIAISLGKSEQTINLWARGLSAPPRIHFDHVVARLAKLIVKHKKTKA